MGDKSDVTGFFQACQNGDTRIAKDFLKYVDSSSLLTIWEGKTWFHVAAIAGDADLLRELAAKLPIQGLTQIIRTKDNKGDTALHLAVRKNHVHLVKQFVCLDCGFIDCANREGETPLELAVTLGFTEIVGIFITCTRNALHYIVKLNQLRVVEFLILKRVDLSEFINQPYQHSEEDRSLTESLSFDTARKHDPEIVRGGDTPLHIAARNKFEHMVHLLLKVPKVDKLALNGDEKTPFEIAREVKEYHESFRIIEKLAYYRRTPRSFMYCAPQVSHRKLVEARKVVDNAYKDKRNAEQVVAALLATMTFAAAFSMPGGFQTDNTQSEDTGSPLLIPFASYKLFLFFDCVAFFLALFVCINWQMIPVHSPGDKMIFMTGNSLMISCSFGFTAFGFMAAIYTVLARKVKTFSWVVLGSLVVISVCGSFFGIRQSLHFALTRARFHRLCGVSSLFDDHVQKVWCILERSRLLVIFRSGDEVSHDLITGHAKFVGLGREDGSSSSLPV